MKTLISLLLLIFCSVNIFAVNPDDILGEWITAKQDAKVEIFKNQNKYFGKIVWLREPTENGKAKVDKNNPSEQYRSTPILNLLILKDFTFNGEKWEDGTIYDPKNGKFYSCKMTLQNYNTLDIRGYIGISLIGRTETWTRANK